MDLAKGAIHKAGMRLRVSCSLSAYRAPHYDVLTNYTNI